MIKKILFIPVSVITGLFGFSVSTHAADLRETIFKRTEGVGRGSFNTDINPESSLLYFIGQATNIIIGALGVIAVIYMIYAGFLWLTAGGNDDQIKKAKTTIRRVIIGMIILTLSYAIVGFVLGQFQGVVPPSS